VIKEEPRESKKLTSELEGLEVEFNFKEGKGLKEELELESKVEEELKEG
jgi:hypothetical protein